MNKKSFSLLVLCILFIQLVIPNFGASEVEQRYAPTNPTPAQVAAANPTDLVVFEDSAFEAKIAECLGVEVGSITVNDMLNLESLTHISYNIKDITGLEYATNLTEIDMDRTQITDLTPISHLTSLTKLNVSRGRLNDLTPLAGLTNLSELTLEDLTGAADLTPLRNLTNLTVLNINICQVKDLRPLSNLTNLTDLSLTANAISDLSPLLPLLTDGTNTNINATGNGVGLEDTIVTKNDEIIRYFTGLNGEKIPFSLGVPVSGDNYLSKSVAVNNNELNGNLQYSAYVYQSVKYIKFDGLTNASTNEEKQLSDEELIALFEVSNEENEAITVDASAVDYSTPGDYALRFSVPSGAVLNPTLTVIDVKPTIDITNNLISIEANSQIPNLIEAFGVTATEIIDGDLSANITFDDSAVNYNTAGTYNVIFTVTDPEGNPVTKTASVEITPEEKVIIEEKESEITSEIMPEEEVVIEEESEITSEEEVITDEKESEVESKTTTQDKEDNVESTKSESLITMTDDDQKGLASTGYKTTILTVILTAIGLLLVTYKKVAIN